MKLKIEYIPVKDLKPYERNTRNHKDIDIDNIALSIQKYGFNDAVGIWKDNIIIEGHGRLLAAEKLGMKEVPCVRLDHLTDEQRREYAIVHNATAELSEWYNDMLSVELPDLNLEGFDFDFDLETQILEDNSVDIREKEVKPFSKGHYLVTYDLNVHDKLIDAIDKLRHIKGVEVEGSLNNDG